MLPVCLSPFASSVLGEYRCEATALLRWGAVLIAKVFTGALPTASLVFLSVPLPDFRLVIRDRPTTSDIAAGHS